MCERRCMIGIPQPSGDQVIEVGGHQIVVDPGSVAFDLEPPQPWTAEQQRLHEEMMAGHFDLATCVDANGPNIWDPSTFTGPTLPPGPLKLVEHHNPKED